jgi:serine/threonine protein kinase
MHDRIDQQFGEYRLVRLIGRGGFADVYLGEHVRRKTLAAVKVLHDRIAHDNLKQFLNEARSFRLKHAHIITLLDFSLEDDFPYLVMEYAPNGSLRQRYPKGTQLTLTSIVGYVKQIADALQYAHDEGVIHRDIKPDNMLLGQHDEVLLSDFGIASIVQTSISLNLQDQAGTVAYMAPEQLQGKPRQASDQYSLGIVVYEWINGDRPFHGTFIEIHAQHLNTLPPSLRSHVPDLPLRVEEVVMTALAKDPRSRFASLNAFANALEQAWLKAESPSPTLYPAGKIAPKLALPVEMKPIGQMPAQQSATLNNIIPSPIAPDAVEEQKLPSQHTPVPLPPHADNSPSQIQAPPAMSIAQPDPSTVSKPVSSLSTSVLPLKKKRRRLFFVLPVILVALLIAVVIFVATGELVLFSGIATKAAITITPASKELKNTYTITAVRKPDAAQTQVQARVLFATSQTLQKTVNASGVARTLATQATGMLTFFNTSPAPKTVPAGTVFLGASGVHVVNDASVTVPASVLPVTGQITVPAHAVNAGSSGTIPANDLNAVACCGAPAVLVSNLTPFTGGVDAQTYSYILQSDIDGTAATLATSLTIKSQADLLKQVQPGEQIVASPRCVPLTSSDQAAGDKVDTVTVSASVYCTGEAFDQRGAYALAENRLVNDPALHPGTAYAPVGHIVTKIQQATVDAQDVITLTVLAEGVWVYQFNATQLSTLPRLVVGKTQQDAQSVLQKQSGVHQTSIQLYGWGASTLPSDINQITFYVSKVQGL